MLVVAELTCIFVQAFLFYLMQYELAVPVCSAAPLAFEVSPAFPQLLFPVVKDLK